MSNLQYLNKVKSILNAFEDSELGILLEEGFDVLITL